MIPGVSRNGPHALVAAQGIEATVDAGNEDVHPVYGRGCTGLGRDGSVGCQHIHAAGGRVIIEDPATAIATSMPKTVKNLGLANACLPMDRIGAQILKEVQAMSAGARVGV